MKILYSLLTMSLMVSLTSTAYAQCGPSTPVTCEPTTQYLDDEYYFGVWGLSIGETSYSSGSSVSEGGYKSNPCSEFELMGESTHNITVTTGIDGYQEQVKVFIDYNNDGVFSNDELVFQSSGITGNEHNGSFSTPVVPETQKIWIRVISDYEFSPEVAPCSSPEYGQVEDFAINLIPYVSTDDGSGPTHLNDTFCSTTIEKMDTQISCVKVTNAEKYEWELTSQLDGTKYYAEKPNNTIKLNQFSDLKYKTVYKVRVRAYVNGDWTDYGKSCNITTPEYPLVELLSSQCGTNLSTLKTKFSCNSVYGATDYEWQFTSQTDASVTIKIKGGTGTGMTAFEAGLKYETTYSVRIRPYIDGDWRSFGSSCLLTTPNYPTVNVVANQCGIVLSSMGSKIKCTNADLATDYEWEFTSLSDATIITKVKGSTTKTMTPKEAGLAKATTYSVRVRPYIDGDWRAYGSTCEVTTPGTALREENNDELFAEQIAVEAEEKESKISESSASVNIFPNPANSSDAISISVSDLNTSEENVTITIVDMVGKIVYNKELKNNNGFVRDYVNFDINVSSGMYIVSIKTSTESLTKRLVIK